jgi:hypothetical protein
LLLALYALNYTPNMYVTGKQVGCAQVLAGSAADLYLVELIVLNTV